MTRIYQQYQRRISFLSLIVIFAWGGLGCRLFNIQIASGEEYSKQCHEQGQTKEIIPALRGNIFDITDLDNIDLFDNVEQPEVFPLGYFAIVEEFKQTITIE